MHPPIHILSFISIMSLMLGSLTGCGEKRIHVATTTETPEQEILIEPSDIHSEAKTAELNDTALDESDISLLSPKIDVDSKEPAVTFASVMPNEPVNMAHAPSVDAKEEPAEPNAVHVNDSASPTAESNISSVSKPSSSPESKFTEATPTRTDDEMANPLLSEGQDVSAQTDSSLEDRTSEEVTAGDVSDSASAFREDSGRLLIEPSSDLMDTPFSQDSATGLKNSFADEDIAPAPKTLEIAKAQPADNLEDQIDRIKKEELASVKAGLQDVFFPFDSWTLTKEGKLSLKNTLDWFKHDFSSVLIIEGHSDQRGTQAYNMILGKRRAHAIRDYLSKSGIDPSHLIPISYGKDKPFCQDITEVCHQLNRRGHLLVQNP